MGNRTIYTIGHSNHTVERLIELLKRYGIEAAADVRSAPYSRYSPQFNKERISRSFSQAGIAYHFLGLELGARPADPECYDETGSVLYERLVERPEFARGINRVLQLAEERTVALICSEKNPKDCHRAVLVSRYLKEKGTEISHILADGDVISQDELEEQLAQPEEQTLDLFQTLADKAMTRRGRKIAYKKDPSDGRKW